MKERLQKIMARANLGSRRACEELIEQKRVRLNGVVAQLGDKADPAIDVIEVDGQKISVEAQRKIYIALNKPINVLTTNLANYKDRRQTVRDLIAIEGHLFSIGRLDAESEGLIVMTNDGELVQRLTHPKFKHTKTYRVSVYGLPNVETLESWRKGIFLQDEDGMTYKTAPCHVEIIKGDREVTTLRVVMTEGRKRQIRRVAASLGHPVQRLVRTQIGKLELGMLRAGEWRELSPKEVHALGTPADELQGILDLQREQRKARRQEEENERRGERRPFRPLIGGHGKPIIGGVKRRRDDDEAEERPYRRRYDDERGNEPPYRRREERDFDERPRRSSRPPTGERGDKPYRPRPEGEERPRRRYEDERSDERPYRRREERDFDERPRRSSRPPTGERGDRPYRPRPEGEERPRRRYEDERGDERRSSRPPTGGYGDRPYRRREEDDRGDERPRRKPRPTSGGDSEDRPKRPRSNRPPTGGQGKPRRPRRGDDDRSERSRRTGGSKPRKPKQK